MIKPLSAAIGSILLASAMSASVHAQETARAPASDAEATDEAKKKEEVKTLGEVIVTGQRSPKAVDQIPGAITVISQEEVAHTLALTEDATAVLSRTVPGYAESSQAMSNSGENLRGRIALRLFDGVPQGTPLREGTRNGTFTDMGVIGSIEVINGPSASEGIGGAGGVINYISRSATREGPETTVVARYSSQFEDDSSGWKLGLTHAYKSGDFDFIGSIARIERGISYDGDGRRIGMNTSGSVSDSTADNVFLKAGFNFGEDGEQRIQGSYSNFKIDGHGDYIQVLGCRPGTCANPITNTSERGSIFGSKAEFNDFEQFTLKYSHADIFGGILVLDYYKADQAMRFLPENGDDRQVGPVLPDQSNRIFDQSEIDSKKHGWRSAWTRPEAFGVEGLEVRVGFDLVHDEAQQRLALTDRVWVPPMEYDSTALWTQISWDLGPVTLSGGYRHQDDELKVEDYTTTYFRKSVDVEGGNVQYKENLGNIGAIWRVGAGFSVFVAYGEGFTLPNIGIPLRNINVPGQSVERIDDLFPIIFTNTEIGFNWRGSRGSFAGSHYDSRSPYGASLVVDPATNDYVLQRSPVRIKGYEFSGEWRFSPTLRVTALYSHSAGMTSFYNGGPRVRPMGVADISPDKFGASMIWNYLPQGDLTLGVTRLADRHLNARETRPSNGQVDTFNEKTEGHTLFDLSIDYRIESMGKVTLGIENLLNEQYILAWSQVDFFQNYWAGRGRLTSVTYSYTF